MIGFLTIAGIAFMALRKKRGVCGVGSVKKLDWIIYRDLVHSIESEIEDYIYANADYLEMEDRPLFEHPRLDVSINPKSRTGYDFDITIDDYENFRYPNKTYDLSRIVDEEADYLDINYEELEYIVSDVLDRYLGIQVSGIGAAKFKRRIYHEIAELQKDVDFTNSFEDQTERGIRMIERNCNILNDMYPNRKRKVEPKRYFNQLRRAYNSIAGIGETTLPFKESKVTNDNGDVILVYRDYGTQHMQLIDAIDWLREVTSATDGQMIGYNETLIFLANGGKLVWNNSKNNIHKGLQAEILARGSNAERKSRISILANPNKGGIYPDTLAHQIWQSNSSYRELDDYYIKEGVLSALQTITSAGQAQNEILRQYYDAHTKLEDDVLDFYMSESNEDQYYVDNDNPF